MTTQKSYKLILVTTFVFVMLALTLVIGRFIAVRPTPTLHHHIPTSANVVLKVNNSSLLHRYGFDLLYKNNTAKKVDLSPFKNSPILSLIPYLNSSELILFIEKWEDESIIGILAKTSTTLQIDSLFNSFPQLVYATSNELICALFLPDELAEQNRQLFQNYAIDLLSPNPDKTNARLAFAKTNINAIFHLYIQGDKESYLQETDLQIFIEGNEIKLSGKSYSNPLFEGDTLKRHKITPPNSTKNFAVTIHDFPDTVAHFITNLYKNLELPIEQKMISQQLISYGFELVNHDKQLLILPLIDAVIRYKDELPSPSSNEIDTLQLGSRVFFKKQLSPHEFYIGLSPEPTFVMDSTSSFSLKGSPAVLMNIEGEGFIAQLTQGIPIIQTSKAFLQDFELFNFTTYPSTDKGKVQLEGTLQFADNQTASLKLLGFLLFLMD